MMSALMLLMPEKLYCCFKGGETHFDWGVEGHCSTFGQFSETELKNLFFSSLNFSKYPAFKSITLNIHEWINKHNTCRYRQNTLRWYQKVKVGCKNKRSSSKEEDAGLKKENLAQDLTRFFGFAWVVTTGVGSTHTVLNDLSSWVIYRYAYELTRHCCDKRLSSVSHLIL